MINVNNKLKIYEINNAEVDCYRHTLEVTNHWNIRDFVVLKIGDTSITVSARDLEAAIKNSTNIARY